MTAKIEFKKVIERITAKQNWINRWTKIQQFIETNRLAVAGQMASKDQSD